MDLHNFDIYAYRVLDSVRHTVNPNQVSFVQRTPLDLIGVNESNVHLLREDLSRRCKCELPEAVVDGWSCVQDICDSLAQYDAEGDPPELS